MFDSDSQREFQTTHWSIVLDARRRADVTSEVRNQSLRELCERYWMPLFAYLRRKGNSPDDTADLVQGFFAELIEKDYVDAVDQRRGRFRWFLMNAVSRYASKERDRSMAKKRGGDQRIVSIDVEAAERSYRNEPIDGWTAEKIFDRRWGIEVLKQALTMLEAEYQSKNQELFEALRSRLTVDADDASGYAEIAEQVGMTASAVKTAAMRLRKRYRMLLRQIVSGTLDESESIDDELSELLSAIRGT